MHSRFVQIIYLTYSVKTVVHTPGQVPLVQISKCIILPSALEHYSIMACERRFLIVLYHGKMFALHMLQVICQIIDVYLHLIYPRCGFPNLEILDLSDACEGNDDRSSSYSTVS